MLGIKVHLPHEVFGHVDFDLADLAIGLGYMPHDRESTGEESGLKTFDAMNKTGTTQVIQATIKIVPKCGAKGCA